jgi:hypothetical protein
MPSPHHGGRRSRGAALALRPERQSQAPEDRRPPGCGKSKPEAHALATPWRAPLRRRRSCCHIPRACFFMTPSVSVCSRLERLRSIAQEDLAFRAGCCRHRRMRSERSNRASSLTTVSDSRTAAFRFAGRHRRAVACPEGVLAASPEECSTIKLATACSGSSPSTRRCPSASLRVS